MDTSCKKDDNLRKTNKQEMERRRRARMNTSIEKLKTIMQKNGFISEADCLKIEKAEILDKVVEFCNQKCSVNINENSNQMKNFPTNKRCILSNFPSRHIDNQKIMENSAQFDGDSWNIINPTVQSNHISRFSVISANHSIINQTKNRAPFAPLSTSEINIENSICNTKSEYRFFKSSFVTQYDKYCYKTNRKINSQIWKPYE